VPALTRPRAGAQADRHPLLLAVVAVTGVGAALRFAHLGSQGYWYDEAHSAYLVRLPPVEMLRQLPVSESTPPLYYCVGWVWARVLGSGEAALRSLSAAAGTAVVPIAYLIGRRLASVGAGLAAALLTACSPLLVWYSQEARAYSLLVLLTAVALLAFLHALGRPGLLPLLLWGASSALALATHYMALIVAVPQAAWLVSIHPRRSRVWAAVAGVAAAAGAWLPLALTPRATMHTAWIHRIPIELRLRQLGGQFLSGFGSSPTLTAGAGLGLAAGVLLLFRGSSPLRRTALGPAALGAAALLLALALAGLGSDEFLTRNLLAAWLPLALAAAVGLGDRGLRPVGVLATLAVCVAWVGVTVAVDRHPALERPDWRRVSRALGPARGARVVVLEHYRSQIPLYLYRPDLVRLRRVGLASVKEVDVVAPEVPRRRACWWGAACNLSNAPPPRIPRGFARQAEVELPSFDIYRLGASRARRVQALSLRHELRHVSGGAVLLERPAAPGGSGKRRLQSPLAKLV
jgi:4-amino-4-deoxy-L-arabinose transferase-like glycosyltransferase